jgi:hypothetical protein
VRPVKRLDLKLGHHAVVLPAIAKPTEEPPTLINLLPFATKMLGRLFLEEAVMANIQVSENLVGREVERLFGKISAKRGDLCTNPVTGGDFVYGLDPIEEQKNAAYKRLLARAYFALHGPADAPRMPTDDYECNRAKYATGLLGFITAHFIWSLENQHDLTIHPPFPDFASGLLWQHDNQGYSLPYFPPGQFAELKKRFPPRKLEGLDHFSWYSPRRQNQIKKNRRAA